MEKFWMVYVEGTRMPSYQHPNWESAKTEAERLAQVCPGKKVFVLETTCFCEVPKPISWKKL